MSSQEALARALEDAGEPVTQATISRDLAALGVVKGRTGYVLPSEAARAGEGEDVGRALRRHATSVAQADALVVVRTAPGHAALVGDVLDRSPPAGCVGTIAGDDTVFVATPGRRDARALAALLLDELERGGGPG